MGRAKVSETNANLEQILPQKRFTIHFNHFNLVNSDVREDYLPSLGATFHLHDYLLADRLEELRLFIAWKRGIRSQGFHTASGPFFGLHLYSTSRIFIPISSVDSDTTNTLLLRSSFSSPICLKVEESTNLHEIQKKIA